MTHLSGDAANQIRQELQRLHAPVRLLFFTSPACGTCAEQQQLLEELAALCDKLVLESHPLESAPAIEHGVDKAPATVVRGAEDKGVHFYGLTGGYEFGALLEAIRLVSHGAGAIDPLVTALAATLQKPVHVEVLTTLACPYCPKMVRLAHQLAVANPRVRADMVDATEFPQWVDRYQLHGVPLTVVNGRRAFEGALPAEQAVLEILKIADPEAYETIEVQLREAQGLRHTRALAPAEIYDVIVVGAGPAGLAAALYAQRKGRKTALIGQQAGGQINDTAQVENYPGVMQVGGTELAQAMRRHVEVYPLAERYRVRVAAITREGERFIVRTDDGQAYRSRSVIFSAGKRYRRLDVPGEDRFIGRGVAWCATCDAPLFQGRRVAVVGGGNSALTAVRDLARYAVEIHLIHLADRFNADPVLVEEVERARAAGKVRFHLHSRVREYLGNERLTGVRVGSSDGATRYDLAVDGVFLEIGLEPNSEPVAELVTLNERGEVPVNRDQSTAVAGLFAAGDVTDEQEKQIVVAAGAGAKAALAADRYLASLDGGVTELGSAG